MRRMLTMVPLAAALFAWAPTFAEELGVHGLQQDLVGEWTGTAIFMLPEGPTRQEHRFVFESQDGHFVQGEHSWEIVGGDISSHDGSEATHAATEPFLGVISTDGVITLVEHGDHTYFRLRLVARDAIDFTAAEGGDYPLVGHGVLVRTIDQP